MTDPRIAWYRDRAEWFGQRVVTRVQNLMITDDYYTAELARVAAHFGALVLGYASLEGKHIAVMDVRVLREPIENYYVPHGAAGIEPSSEKGGA